MEAQLSNLKDDLEKERQKSRAAQANYERQVFSKVSSPFLFYFIFILSIRFWIWWIFYDIGQNHVFSRCPFL